MSIETLKAPRKWWTTIQGEKMDISIFRKQGWHFSKPSSKNHKQLFLPGSQGNNSKYGEDMQEEGGHFDLFSMRHANVNYGEFISSAAF